MRRLTNSAKRTNPYEIETRMRRPARRPIYALLAGALVCLLVAPITFAGAASGPVATKSASLRQQVKSLKRRVTALENKQTTQTTQTTATGPAGGDLAGTYPNPTIGPNKVTADKIPDATLTGNEIAPESLYANDLGPSSVGTSEIVNNSVGATELRGENAVVGAGVGVAGGGASQEAKVSCPAFHRLIAGGFAWQNDQAGTSIIYSAPDESIPNSTWLVRGRATQNNTLYAWATCLQF